MEPSLTKQPRNSFMKYLLTSLWMFVVCSTIVFAQTATAPTSGDGTSSNPYQIATLDNLYWLSQNSSVWDKYFRQTADIDASTTFSWNGGAGFSPIGNGTNAFTGTYHGGGHAIKNVHINNTTLIYIGFFGYSSGAIDSLFLQSGSIISSITVYSDIYIGGFVGWQNGGSITNCCATASVSSTFISDMLNSYVGGFVGWQNGGSITNCYTTGSVSASASGDQVISWIGGFVGSQNGGSITNCYAIGSISISGLYLAGAFTGAQLGSISSCFWNTETSGMSTGIGFESGTVTGLTSTQMKDKSTFMASGWDFTTVWGTSGSVNSGFPYLQWQNSGVIDSSEVDTLSGDGGSANPYIIATLKDLQLLSDTTTYWNGKYFIQTADIDASGTSSWNSGTGFSPIGNSSTNFTGRYNGNGHSISNLTIDRSSINYVGLFGYIGSAGEVDSLTVTNSTITGQNYVGTLAGRNSGTMTMCAAANDTVSGAQLVGGLAGWNEPGTITQCYSTGKVTGISSGNAYGGLVGWSYAGGGITNCYSTASVAASSGSRVGGLVGFLFDGTTTNCYAAGTVSGSSGVGGLIGYEQGSDTVTNCFYDNSVFTSSTSYGTGASTTVMQTQSTFIDAGWDFSTPIWKNSSSVNNGYPYLQWQAEGLVPVELASFTATTANNTATLAWSTATETNNYGFNIERRIVETVNSKSQNTTTNWEKLEFVKGSGTSSSAHSYSYTDANVSSGTYAYRLKQIDNDGTYKYSSEAEVTVAVPTVFALGQNYPNPFNPSTVISYSLPVNGSVSMKVYDILGREVVTLVNEVKNAGSYEVTFNASKLASGVYFYKLQSGSYMSVKKLVLMK
jgi:hypothetical protein